jgi:hypothetical protein
MLLATSLKRKNVVVFVLFLNPTVVGRALSWPAVCVVDESVGVGKA